MLQSHHEVRCHSHLCVPHLIDFRTLGYGEETYFAKYEPKLGTSIMKEEHYAFNVGVSAFEAYLAWCLPPARACGFMRRAILYMTLISMCYAAQLIHEVAHLERETFRSASVTEAEMRHIAEVTEAFIKTCVCQSTASHSVPDDAFDVIACSQSLVHARDAQSGVGVYPCYVEVWDAVAHLRRTCSTGNLRQRTTR